MENSPGLDQLLAEVYRKAAADEETRIKSGVNIVNFRLTEVLHGLPSKATRSEQLASPEQVDMVAAKASKIRNWLLKNGKPGTAQEDGFPGNNHNFDDDNFGLSSCDNEEDDVYLIIESSLKDESGSSININMRQAGLIEIEINFSKRSPVGHVSSYRSAQRPLAEITPEEAQITSAVFDKFLDMKGIT